MSYNDWLKAYEKLIDILLKEAEEKRELPLEKMAKVEEANAKVAQLYGEQISWSNPLKPIEDEDDKNEQSKEV